MTEENEAPPADQAPEQAPADKPAPADASAGDPPPAESSAAESPAAPTEAKPAEAKPAEAKPAEAKPAEAKPAEAKPAEAKPAETKPDEAFVSVPDDLAEAGDAEATPRRRRARRAVAKPPAPEPRERKPRPPRKRRGDEGGPRDDTSVLGGSPLRRARVFRQDPIDGIEPLPEPPAPTPEEQKAKKANDQTQTTLILHPAPKAGGHVRKKKKQPKTAKEALKAKTSKKGPKKNKAEKKKAVELKAEWTSATAEDAVAVLTEAGPAAEALVKVWLEADNVDAIAAGAASEDLSGKPRKAVRRAASVLKSRGVDLPEAEAPPTAMEPEAPEAPVATFVPPDASGTTFISISQRQPGGRYLVADCVVRHNLGVIRASQGRLAGKQIRAWKNRVEKEYGTAPTEIPLDWARHRIAEARKQNAESGAVVPLGFDSCAPLFEPVPEEAPPHPLADLMSEDFDQAALEKAVADSERLHDQPEFRSWMPDRRSIDEMLAKVGEAVGSEEAAGDPEKVNEALKVEVAAATDRFFTPELRGAVSSWMQDAAICLRDRAGDEPARRALMVAQAVREAGLITSPPNEIPFLQTFFQKAVAYVVAQNQGQLRVPVPQAQAGA